MTTLLLTKLLLTHLIRMADAKDMVAFGNIFFWKRLMRPSQGQRMNWKNWQITSTPPRTWWQESMDSVLCNMSLGVTFDCLGFHMQTAHISKVWRNIIPTMHASDLLRFYWQQGGLWLRWTMLTNWRGQLNTALDLNLNLTLGTMCTAGVCQRRARSMVSGKDQLGSSARLTTQNCGLLVETKCWDVHLCNYRLCQKNMRQHCGLFLQKLLNQLGEEPTKGPEPSLSSPKKGHLPRLRLHRVSQNKWQVIWKSMKKKEQTKGWQVMKIIAKWMKSQPKMRARADHWIWTKL